jgi:hypothetical protein
MDEPLCEFAIGFAIFDEVLFQRVPSQFPIKPRGDVAQVTKDVRLHGILNRADAAAPAPDGFEEVADVV